MLTIIYSYADKFLMHHTDSVLNPEDISTLGGVVEQAKRGLSVNMSSSMQIDHFIDGYDFHHTLTRAKLEELNAGLFSRSLEPVTQVLSRKIYLA